MQVAQGWSPSGSVPGTLKLCCYRESWERATAIQVRMQCLAHTVTAAARTTNTDSAVSPCVHIVTHQECPLMSPIVPRTDSLHSLQLRIPETSQSIEDFKGGHGVGEAPSLMAQCVHFHVSRTSVEAGAWVAQSPGFLGTPEPEHLCRGQAARQNWG